VQKLEKYAQAWGVTGWRLRDGEVVWRAADGHWVERFDDSEVLSVREAADAALEAAQADEKARIVIAPYLFQVVEEDGHPVPMSVRERIRAKGPTVRLDVGKQAAQA
jgi:Protein of unknown function (DUF2849)